MEVRYQRRSIRKVCLFADHVKGCNRTKGAKNQTQSRTYGPKVERNEKKSRYFAYKTLPSAAIAGKTPSVEEASFPNHALRREYLATEKKDLNCNYHIRTPPSQPENL